MKSEWRKTPFALNMIEGRTQIAFPSAETNDGPTRIAIGVLLYMAQKLGYEIVELDMENTTSLYSVLKSWSDILIGAYRFVDRQKLEYVSSIPSPYNIGWEFMQWYAFMDISKITEGHDYLNLSPQTCLSSSGKRDAAWLGTNIISIHERVCSMLRLVAKKISPELDNPVRYIRSYGYIEQRIVGKKPVPGIYLEPELTLLTKEWESRKEELHKKFAALPIDWATVRKRTDGLSSYLAELNVKHSSKVREIMDNAQKRIPQLLVTRKVKRETINILAKGTTLSDKLREIGGGKSVRTIAQVLYSPLSRVEKSEFISSAMQLAKLAYQKKGFNLSSEYLQKNGYSDQSVNVIIGSQPWFDVAIRSYLENIPERIEEESWRLTFV
jgi:hypothetical protein